VILAGDIGGTNSRLALFREEGGSLHLSHERKYPSREHNGLEEILNVFLDEAAERVHSACLGIAGPVFRGQVQASNLPWLIDAQQLSRQSGIETVWLINDLEAHASGISDLQENDLVSLNSAAPQEGNAALIAAGTGLGETALFWDGRRHHVFASEGGHADFAPRTDLEIALLQYLRNKFGRVSYERVLAGRGFKNIYDFLCDTKMEIPPDWLQQEIATAADPSAVITQRGLEGKASICERTLDIFVAVYGAEAGNLALRMLARGGVFLSGGIAVKILPKLKGAAFLDAFTAKGRLSPLLEKVPVKVIVNEKVGLIGAARYALTKEAEEENDA
jgi:glucokinase